MNVDGISGGIDIARLVGQSGFSGANGLPLGLGQGGPPSQITSIRNEEGQSLLDIRDELKSAVQGAMQDFDGSGDPRAAIQDAIQSTLESNGFDPAEVKGAMKDSGFGGMRSLMGGGGGFGPGGPGGLGGGLGGGFDPAAIMRDGGSEDEMIQTFLRQFRAGTNLDFEA